MLHKIGSASIEATGTSHGQSRLAPSHTSATASGRRIASGPPSVCLDPAARTPIHSAHRPGARIMVGTAIAAVTPSATDSFRHSPRNANHRTPTPGVTLVSSANDQSAGQRRPNTATSARKTWMFARVISDATGGVNTTNRVAGPARIHTPTATLFVVFT